MSDFSLKLFSGTSHPELAKAIAKELHITLGQIQISRFACGEIFVKPLETVRGCDVFVLQTSTSRVNEELMELFIMLDALKRSFASRVHLIIPHYGYARQDRVNTAREPISAKLVADLISAAGADHVITISLHSDQEQGFFDFPVDNLSPRKLFVDYLTQKKLKNIVIVSPDVGGAKEAKRFADLMNADLAIIHKSRPAQNVSEVSHVVGNVEGRVCILYDDMVDTAGSICNAKQALLKFGASDEMYVVATHAVFSSPASARLSESGFAEVVVTDTIPLSQDKMFPALKVLSVASLLAHTVQNVHEAKSVSGLWA